uniref:Uncharacterized protein n=1 Tax=Culex tarsalis TaxID=7177 RepID=A0A1Q3F6Q5_CULTA
MLKFNRFASEEEAKIPSPIGKKKPEKNAEDTISSENLLQHPKAKEWLIAAANANYQELAKLSTDHPNLVKLQDMSTGYTALHWAAKHGNEDVVKLVAGTLKADVNARTNGGYTALHIAMQFGRNDIFELLCNVYKADRDLLDWSGKKALEYQKQMTSVSASTYSSEYDPMFVVNERFHSLPSKKILSPLARGGTFMRKKSRRQRPSTTTGVELQRTHSMLTMISPENLSLATTTNHVSADRNNRSSLAVGGDTMSLYGGAGAGTSGNLRRADKTNQSFFRRKKTQH